jgi:CheY-like chemotaxis protein
MSTTLYRTILLIDDDTEDQEMFTDALKKVYPEIRCFCHDDVEEVLQLLTRKEIDKPDMFFIDLNMPKLNGIAVLKKLKSVDSLKHIPVIMYSTFFGKSDVKEFEAFGAVHYLIKSTRFSDLCETLKDTLSKTW